MATKDAVPPGSARLELVDGVALLHEEDAVLDAMLTGWAKQQRGGRRLTDRYIASGASVVQTFVTFTDAYPWQWTAGLMDDWTAHLVGEQHLAHSTVRNYQGAVRTFCDYITSPYYDWPAECEKRFGTHPIQVCHEWNTALHVDDYEGRPDRRPLTRQECQDLFNYADEQVERAARSGRKGALPAYRDATILKVIYAWGLRCNEACKLDRTDFYRNPKAPELGRFGVLHVRYGKATRGSGPRRRAVASVMPWAVVAVEDYLVNIRPKFGHLDRPALWLTERGGRLRTREVEDRFSRYRDALGMDPNLSPHCLRHSYVSHQIEDGVDPEFVRQQVGHRYRSTTGLYTTISGDAMNTMMRKALDRVVGLSEEGTR